MRERKNKVKKERKKERKKENYHFIHTYFIEGQKQAM